MTFGSNRGMVAQNQSAVTDEQGNAIVNAGNSFGDSPAGNALLTQSLFGLPNGTLSLTPPDVYSAISNDNQVPYWQFSDYSNGVMAGSAIYDATAQTWGVIINPGTAASGDYCTFTTRSYLVNDDNLGLRQKATTVITKGGTAAAGTAWNLTLSATYYDATNTAVSTAIIGTVYDANTWTSISGFTVSGGSAVTASARYVDLQYKLTASAAITGSATVTIKSLFLATKIGANASFNVADVYTANGTWTRPTGVDYVTVVAIGGGGGGGSGPLVWYSAGVPSAGTARFLSGASGGGGSRVAYLPNFYVGDQTSVAIGIGAGGSGGTANTRTSGSANTSGVNGSAGGATTFGSYLSVSGGGGGIGGAIGTALAAGPAGGTAAGATTTTIFGASDSAGGVGAVGGSAANSTTVGAGQTAGTSSINGITLLPFVSSAYLAAGTAGAAGTTTVAGTGTVQTGNGTAGAGGGSGYISGGGAAGGCSVTFTATPTVNVSNASAGASGGAGGGGATRGVAYPRSSVGTVTVTLTGGAGGNASLYSGAGGGAGGGVEFQSETVSITAFPGTATSGAGGQGGGGIVIVGYTA